MAITTQSGASSSDFTTLLGTELADTFTLTDNDLYIDALEGNDTVTSSDASDDVKIEAGDGNDTITFTGDLTKADFDLGDGADVVSVSDISGTIDGGNGSDDITVTRNMTSGALRGQDGADTIAVTGDLSNAFINGGKDDDILSVTGAMTKATIYGGKQQDQITVDDLTSSLIRGDDNEDTITVTGDLTSSFVNGNAGNDTFSITSASISASTIFGGSGNDSISLRNGTGAGAYVSGDKGDDIIENTLANSGTSSSAATLSGGDGDDTITDGTGVSSIGGGAGDDIITSGGGNDVITANIGDDTINLSTGNVTARGGAGDDIIAFADHENLAAEKTIGGDSGDDTILITDDLSESINDTQFEGVTSVETLEFTGLIAAAESIVLGAKAEAAGIRTVDNSGAQNANLALTVNTSTFSAGVTFIGSDAATIDDIFIGGAGADSMSTGTNSGNAEAFTGGAGNDTFTIAGAGNDVTVNDLSGNDALVVKSTANGVEATVSANFTATAATSNSKAGIANVGLNSAGFDVDMSLATGSVGFEINNTGGAATLKGSSNADVIVGGAASDSIIGNGGADDISGGGGAADSLTGGAGDDAFTQSIDATASTTIFTDFDDGAVGTVADTAAFTLANLNAYKGGFGTAIDAMVDGNAVDLTAENMVLEVIADDTALNAATTIVGLAGKFADDAAAEADVLTAGDNTFTLTAVDDNDGILIAYVTTTNKVNLAIGQFNGAATTSNLIDGIETIATFDSVTSLANLVTAATFTTA